MQALAIGVVLVLSCSVGVAISLRRAHGTQPSSFPHDMWKKIMKSGRTNMIPTKVIPNDGSLVHGALFQASTLTVPSKARACEEELIR